jgi:hypothetical protein
MVILNLIANIILTFSGTIFFLQLYGGESSIVHKWKFISHWGLKFGLAALTSGSFLNVITLSNPGFGETLMNLGLAAIFSWAVVFHYKIFSKYGKEK